MKNGFRRSWDYFSKAHVNVQDWAATIILLSGLKTSAVNLVVFTDEMLIVVP